jgi:hypothetical protein
MATPSIIKYPLDVTGLSPTNRIVGEELVVPQGPRTRAFALQAGPFFANSVVITYAATGVPLVKGEDYDILYLNQDATVKVGQPIMSVVWVHNQDVFGQLLANYQVLGGDFSSNASAIAMLIETLQIDDRAVEWDNILYKPVYYPPAPHLHHVRDWYGFDDIIEALDRISAALGSSGGDVDLSDIYLRLDQIDVDMQATDAMAAQLSQSLQTGLIAIQQILTQLNTANVLTVAGDLLVGRTNLFMAAVVGRLPDTTGKVIGTQVFLKRRQIDILPDVEVFDRNTEQLRFRANVGPDFTYATKRALTAVLVEPKVWEITL